MYLIKNGIHWIFTYILILSRCLAFRIRLSIVVISIIFIPLLSSCTKTVLVQINKRPQEHVGSRSILQGTAVYDHMLHKVITRELKQALPNAYHRITITIIRGKVELTGSLNSPEEVAKCLDIIWSKEGVTTVDNYLEIDNRNKAFDTTTYAHDASLTNIIKFKALMSKEVNATNFAITTHKATVYIFGVARSDIEVRNMAQIAAGVIGVEKVVVNVSILP